MKTLAVAALLLLPATAASAHDDGLTNGPDGSLPYTPDSARGFDGINAVAPERGFLYHPERAGNAAAALRIVPGARDGVAEPLATSPARRARHHRQRRLPR